MSNSGGQDSAEEEAIEATAAAWQAQREEGLAPDQMAEFSRWRWADSRHEAAMARLEETCGVLRKMPLLGPDLRIHRTGAVPALHRRRWRTALKFAAAIALVLTPAVSLWWLRTGRANAVQTYATTEGGYARATLRDGSVIELNASSEVRVRFSAVERRITLVAGEAHFSVAKNREWPFVVSAGQVSVRAVGTAFNVRLEKTAVEVLVTEGKVRVTPAASVASVAAPEIPVLVAGERLVIPSDRSAPPPKAEKMAPAALHETLAWQAPRLVFVETPLSEVVERFNRRNRLQLVLGDPELAQQPVGGSFRADNVEAFVRLLESSRAVVAERVDADHIVLRKRR